MKINQHLKIASVLLFFQIGQKVAPNFSFQKRANIDFDKQFNFTERILAVSGHGKRRKKIQQFTLCGLLCAIIMAIVDISFKSLISLVMFSRIYRQGRCYSNFIELLNPQC